MSQTATLILTHGRVHTLDRQNPLADAVAIADGKILAVGSHDRIMSFAADGTQIIDLKGHTAIPGLNDSHLHLIRGGLNYNLELRWEGVPSLADALRMLKDQADRTPSPQWVRVVGGWSEFQFAERRMPTLEELNDAAPDTPVFVLHLYDRALLNRAALKAVGYTKETPDPAGGEIVRDGNGNPTGMLIAKPNAMILYSTLAKGPKLLLLDEPMGALDKKLRSQMQLELVSIIESSGVTCVMVTHDQEEAMTMATRIAVMDAGWIQQVGKPDEVYEQPANRFVAEFIGSVNLFDGVIDEDLPEYVTVRSPLFPAPIYIAHGITGYEGQPVAFALRPEKVMIGKDEPEGHTNKAQGVIEDIAYFGSHSVYHVRLPSGAKVLANFANSQRWASDGLTWGDSVWVHWRDNDGVVLTS